MISMLRKLLKRGDTSAGLADITPADYWTQHNVTGHHTFSSAAESLEYFRWRNDQYVDYIEMMPVAGFDGKVVLDYGCGPGMISWASPWPRSRAG